ncbi:hypothetical protein HanPI659440_Chr06g0251181 [Helianthus annuus]|nr:hypothetical protein HanPI659440_Chr06g0251181 [Helianthus annuus]
MKFCQELTRTEMMKISCYSDMLRAEFREFFAPSKCETLNELINWASDKEIELKSQEERGQERPIERSAIQSPSQKPRSHDHAKKESLKGGAPVTRHVGSPTNRNAYWARKDVIITHKKDTRFTNTPIHHGFAIIVTCRVILNKNAQSLNREQVKIERKKKVLTLGDG